MGDGRSTGRTPELLSYGRGKKEGKGCIDGGYRRKGKQSAAALTLDGRKTLRKKKVPHGRSPPSGNTVLEEVAIHPLNPVGSAEHISEIPAAVPAL